MSAPGGIISDICITVELVTTITGTLDPTPLSDCLGATAQLAQGQYGDAAVTFAGSLIPGGADKIAKHISRVPTGAMIKASDDVLAMGANTSRQVSRKRKRGQVHIRR